MMGNFRVYRPGIKQDTMSPTPGVGVEIVTNDNGEQ